MIAHLFLRRIELYCLVSGGVGRHAFDLGDRRQLVLPVASTILADRDGQSSRPPANSCAGHRLCRYTVWANSIDTPTDSHKDHYVNWAEYQPQALHVGNQDPLRRRLALFTPHFPQIGAAESPWRCCWPVGASASAARSVLWPVNAVNWQPCPNGRASATGGRQKRSAS